MFCLVDADVDVFICCFVVNRVTPIIFVKEYFSLWCKIQPNRKNGFLETMVVVYISAKV